jgi:sterol desaturase/sphingolipid hydroxylase (fatty acid hydroxylase superfamily)
MQTVKLVRRSSSQRQRRDRHFFHLFYLPLNVLLLYATLTALFPWNPTINERHQYQWYQSYGPEWWAVLHVVLFMMSSYFGYMLAKKCYHPRRFLWLPIALGLCLIIIYG